MTPDQRRFNNVRRNAMEAGGAVVDALDCTHCDLAIEPIRDARTYVDDALKEAMRMTPERRRTVVVMRLALVEERLAQAETFAQRGGEPRMRRLLESADRTLRRVHRHSLDIPGQPR